jgi:hypothetical protein
MNRKGEKREENERRKFKWKKMQNQVEARVAEQRKKCQRLSKRCKWGKNLKYYWFRNIV